MQEMRVRSLGWEDPLEQEMATQSSVAWRIAQRVPWTEEPGGLQAIGSQRIRHDWGTNTYAYVTRVQSCLTLCDPMDYSSPGSSVHRISQARILEQVAISFSRGSFHLEIEPLSHVSCIGLWIFYHCATWKAHICITESLCYTLETSITL